MTSSNITPLHSSSPHQQEHLRIYKEVREVDRLGWWDVDENVVDGVMEVVSNLDAMVSERWIGLGGVDR